MGGSVSGQHTQERAMADVLDQLQEQEDLINRLHIQAVRQQLSSPTIDKSAEWPENESEK